MEQSDGLVSVVVYLAILAFAGAWFLLPRWMRRRKASQREKAASQARHAKPIADADPH
jgi:predicted MFS family arabinose efflux permease